MPLPYYEWRCGVCHKTNAEKEGVEEFYSFGAYAGKYHEKCWPKSGFRDAIDPNAKFDSADAGESMDYDGDYRYHEEGV